MKKVMILLLSLFITCGPSEAEIQERISQAVNEATSTTLAPTTTILQLLQHHLLLLLSKIRLQLLQHHLLLLLSKIRLQLLQLLITVTIIQVVIYRTIAYTMKNLVPVLKLLFLMSLEIL